MKITYHPHQILSCLCVLGSFLQVCSCTSSVNNEDKTNVQDTITVAVMPTMECLPLFVAQETGIDDSLGSRLNLMGFNALDDCDKVMNLKNVSATVSDYIHSERLLQKSRGRYIVIPNENTTLTMIVNSRNRIKEAKQLADKMVAVDRKGADNEVGQFVLDSVRLGDNKAFLVNILDVNLRLAMLLNNEMDGIVVNAPHSHIARSAGNNIVYEATRHQGKTIGQMVFKTKESRIHIIDIYNRACDSLNKNGIHNYDSIIIKRLNVPEKYIKAIPNHKFKKLG